MVTTRSKPTSQNPQSSLPRPLENFKAAVLKVAAENLRRQLTAEEVKRVEEDLARKAHFLSHTPHHPPYAAMIRMALLELNEEDGSSEESISDFIKRENPDLSWAHSSYLKHHLDKLCNSEQILVNPENRYLLFDENTPKSASSKREKSQKETRETRGQLCKKRNKENEKNQASGLEVVLREEQNEMTEDREIVGSEQQEKKKMRIKIRISENEPTIKTIVPDLPLAVVDETPLELVENVEKIQGRKITSAYRNKKAEAASTTDLILNFANPNSRPYEENKGRGRGRPRKIESYGESGAEIFKKRGRGRPKKEREDEKLQKREQPRRRGRPRKVDL